jgi:hypothetical protein
LGWRTVDGQVHAGFRLNLANITQEKPVLRGSNTYCHTMIIVARKLVLGIADPDRVMDCLKPFNIKRMKESP